MVAEAPPATERRSGFDARAWLNRRAWARVGDEWRFALAVVVIMRVALGLAGVIGLRLRPITTVNGNWTNLVVPGNDVPTLLVSAWQRWDALWYQEVAQFGYSSTNANVGFPPLFPLASKIASLLFLGNIPLGELLATSVALVVGIALLIRLAEPEIGPRAARLASLLMVLSPHGFFLLAPFTESLFLACTVGAFLLARQGRHWEAGILGAAAALTRYIGVLIFIPLVYEYLRSRAEQRRRVDVEALATAFPVLAFVLLQVLFVVVLGQKQSYFEVQKPWGVAYPGPWNTVPRSIAFVIARHDVVELLNPLTLLVLTVLGIVGLRRLRLAYAFLVFPTLLLLWWRTGLISPMPGAARYALVLFPCWMALAVVLRRRPLATVAVLILFAFTQELLFDHWIHFGWVA